MISVIGAWWLQFQRARKPRLVRHGKYWHCVAPSGCEYYGRTPALAYAKYLELRP